MTKRILPLLALSVASNTFAAAPLSFTVEPRTQYLFDADAGDVSLSVFRAGTVVTASEKFSEGTTFSLRAEGEYSQYDFDVAEGGVGGFAAGDSASDLVRLELRPTISVFLSPTFGLFAGAYAAAGAEIGADFSNAITYGGYVGANYKIADNIWIGGGVGFVTELEDPASFYPLVNAYWQLTPKLLLTADGLGGRLSYAATEQCTLFFDGRYEFREFRLDDNDALPGGALRDSGVPLSVGVKYAFSPDLSVTVAGGAVVYRTIHLSDAGGNDVLDDNADPSAFGSASLEWKF